MRLTEAVIVRENCLAEIVGLAKKFLAGYKAKIIADDNTWRACGEQVEKLLANGGVQMTESFVFPSEPPLYADIEHCEEVESMITGNDFALISVGAGTINDICKLASGNQNKPYISVATASSVDGFNSFGAAINVHGFKKTLACDPPVAVLADSKVLCSAPNDLLSSGYGDLYAKVPAGAGWIVADALGRQTMRKDVWDLLQPTLKPALAHPQEYINKEPKVVLDVFSSLLNSGLAMQKMMDSRPASGAEHLFSHVLEMEHLSYKNGAPVSHGHKVALGTLITTALYEELVNMPEEKILQAIADKKEEPWEEREEKIKKYYADSPAYNDIIKASKDKFISGDSFKQFMQLMKDKMPEMRKGVAEQIISFDETKRRFEIVGCPTKFSDINLEAERVRTSIYKSQMIRSRYTIVDVLYDIGLFDECVERTMARF